MRLAFTRGCRNFPQLDMMPIHLGFYQVYAMAAYSIGSTFVLHDPEIGMEIRELVVRTQEKLLPKRDADRLVLGFAQTEAKNMRALVLGLDMAMGKVLIDFHRDNHGGSAVKARRNALLMARRNLLANESAEEALQLAQARFKDAERGEAAVNRAEPDAG